MQSLPVPLSLFDLIACHLLSVDIGKKFYPRLSFLRKSQFIAEVEYPGIRGYSPLPRDGFLMPWGWSYWMWVIQIHCRDNERLHEGPMPYHTVSIAILFYFGLMCPQPCKYGLT
ncbi:hypothetical protein Ancab_023382 [Ancistrocladus abbreviatus]